MRENVRLRSNTKPAVTAFFPIVKGGIEYLLGCLIFNVERYLRWFLLQHRIRLFIVLLL